MDKNTHKPGAIAKTLGVSTVTIRNYVREFSPFLSPGALAETNRRFTVYDLQVLRLAATLLREGASYEQARQELKERLPLEGELLEDVPEPEPEPGYPAVPRGTPSAIAPLEFFREYVTTLREEHQSTLQAKDEHLETLKAENERLHRAIEWLRLPFFVKWFRKPG